MTSNDLQPLIADRLEHLADRVDTLLMEGKHAEAQVLRNEGLALAASYDRDETFLVLGDFTSV